MKLFQSKKPEKINRRLVHKTPHSDFVDIEPGSSMLAIVLGSSKSITTVLDVASKTIVRWRVPWPTDVESDLRLFDLVRGELAFSIERDDLAQPEAINLTDLPVRLGSYRGKRLRKWLEALKTPSEGQLFGFRGPSSPYWEFRGERPSVALITPERGPQVLRRDDDGTTWVRFGWAGEDIWLFCDDPALIRMMETTRVASLSGKDLAAALGYKAQYVLAVLSAPVGGHCYKVCLGILPRN
jgi:hypothetical protein